jgi:hypothetical protein
LEIKLPYDHDHDSPVDLYKLSDKFCQCLTAGQWFSPGIPLSSTNKTDCQDITEILLKVALYTVIYNNM